jgi:hypothetical protein
MKREFRETAQARRSGDASFTGWQTAGRNTGRDRTPGNRMFRLFDHAAQGGAIGRGRSIGPVPDAPKGAVRTPILEASTNHRAQGLAQPPTGHSFI